MKKVKLDKRLQAVAKYVRPDSKVADIGTDHGYLPIYLALEKQMKQVTASDVHGEPLERASKNIQQYGLSGRIQTVLSDGLEKIPAEKADDIIIAGMGGELIIHIIEQAQWLRDPSKRLILQPMTGFDLLRRFLYNNGYEILEEMPVHMGRHAYCILCVEYTGRISAISDCFAFLGKVPESDTDEKYPYMERQLKRIRKLLKGAVATGNLFDQERYEKLEKEVLEFLKST